MNVETLRNQFPIFKQVVNGYPFIYFDSASTAQVPQSVVDSIVNYYATYKSNVGRGIYTYAEQSTAAYEGARSKVANFIGSYTDEIVFTSGATEGLNIIAQSFAQNVLSSGDEILISAVEHHSNFVPWQQLAIQKNVTLKIVPVRHDGTVDIALFSSYLSFKTKLVAITHSSNIFGSTNDVVEITRLAHCVGAKVIVDASQSIAHQPINVATIGCDFLVFSGHKLFGPTGIGVLFAARSMESFMHPIKFGGGMVFSVQPKHTDFKKFPHNFEAGTPPIAQAIGLRAAIDFILQHVDFSLLRQHEYDLRNKMALALKDIPGVIILGGGELYSDSHIVTFYSSRHHGHDIAAYLDQFGVAVRAGHHCVQQFHKQCGINASVRISFSLYNTAAEVEFVANLLKVFLS